MLQSIPNVPRESQNVCLVELFSTTDVVLSHIRRTDSRSASSNFSFKYAKNNNSTCLKNVSCIPKIWSQCLKVTQKCLMSGEFQTLCLARYVYKKVSWKSFIINLWKQRLVFAFFLLLLPCWEWFVGVGQYLSCVKERDYSLTGKSCLQLTWCLFAFVVLKRRPKKRWWCFFALLQKSMNDPLHEENLHLNNDFLSDKKKSLALPKSQFSLVFSRQHIVWKFLKVSHLNFVLLKVTCLVTLFDR